VTAGPARRCCFADAVAARVAGCTRADRSTDRCRRTVRCTSGEAHGRCAGWLDQVRRSANFALGARQSPSALSRRAAARLQSGSLLGMADVLDGAGDGGRIQDVAGLVSRALSRYGSFDNIPLQPVMQRVSELDRNDE